MSIILLGEMQPYKERYAALPMQPLKISCELCAPVAHYHNLHFDGLLAYAVMEEATQGAMVPQSTEFYDVPLPIHVAWRSNEDVPLYASTDMLPATAVQDVIYYHRRALEPTMTPKNLRPTQGRHKEKRTPLPATVTSELACYAYGNMQEIGRLLETMTAIGKKHSTLGTVQRWLISPVEHFSFVDQQRRARRPLPVVALYGNWPLAALDTAKHIAFTPPYWHWLARGACIDTGQRVPDNVTMGLMLP